MMQNTNSDAKLALEEMRFQMQQMLDAAESLDRKVNIILVACGLVIALGTELLSRQQGIYPSWVWCTLGGVVVLYVTAVAAALYSINPRGYRLAVSPEWEEIDNQILGRSERDAMLVLLSGYVEQIQYNATLNRRKANLLRFALVVLLIAMMALFIVPILVLLMG